MVTDWCVNTKEQLRDILDRITFRPSCVNMDWKWEVEEIWQLNTDPHTREHASMAGWFVNTTFVRPDTNTGEVGRGAGRKEFIAAGTSISGVVKTCWLLAELIVRHELMEAFCYDGIRVFDPHRTVDQLQCRCGLCVKDGR